MQAIALAAVLILIVIGSVLLTVGGFWWFQPLASNWASIDAMMMITIVVTGVAFIAVNLFIAYVVFRYRSQKGRQALFQPDDHRLEKILIAITTVGIVVLLAPGLFFYARYINPPPGSHVVEVLAQQWQWSYRYPGQDGVLGHADPKLISGSNPFGIDTQDPASRDDILIQGKELHLPAGIPVIMQIRAVDVLHSFYVPEFRIKMDAVPGIVTKAWFTPEKTGEFQVLCAELCGIGHFTMLSKVTVDNEGDFQKWLGQQATVAQMMGLEQ